MQQPTRTSKAENCAESWMSCGAGLAGLGWAGLGAGLGWAGLGWAGLGWAGLGAGLGWAGLGWAGLGWARKKLRKLTQHETHKARATPLVDAMAAMPTRALANAAAQTIIRTPDYTQCATCTRNHAITLTSNRHACMT